VSGDVSLSPATGKGILFVLDFLNIKMVSLCILDDIFYCLSKPVLHAKWYFLSAKTKMLLHA